MKLIIDIPEETYKATCDGCMLPPDVESVVQGIKDGVPLKVHGKIIKTWNLDDARECFMSDVYNTLDFLPTNNEANRIIDSFDRVTSGIIQQPCEDCISRQYLLDNCVVDKVTMPYVPVSKKEESEDKLDGDPVDIDKAVEHYEGTLEALKGIDLEVDA